MLRPTANMEPHLSPVREDVTTDLVNIIHCPTLGLGKKKRIYVNVEDELSFSVYLIQYYVQNIKLSQPGLCLSTEYL